MKAFAQLIWEVRRTRNSQAVSDFVWACWELHAYLAGIGKGLLLDTLYLSIMDVGVSYLRAVLEATAPAVHLNPLAEVMEDLVNALESRDTAGAIDALRRTDPTMILREPTAP
ncbi:FCD domain-containing protein [Rhodococcus sp. NPDC059968]|uniref:FCD domain-containing protein n=1 Tax=Rhodococcus sp. NPDC059968 TaxID=3347017 RepID=UPI00366D5676